jgi:hypothetical protein
LRHRAQPLGGLLVVVVVDWEVEPAGGAEVAGALVSGAAPMVPGVLVAGAAVSGAGAVVVVVVVLSEVPAVLLWRVHAESAKAAAMPAPSASAVCFDVMSMVS